MNKLEFTLNLGHDFGEILKLNEEGGYSLDNAMGKLMSFSLEASLSPDLPNGLAKTFDNVGKMMHIPVDLIKSCANTLKSWDFAIQFSSTEELPEKARKIIGSEYKLNFKPYNGWTEMDKKCLRTLYAANGLEVFCMVPEFCVFHFKVHVPEF